MRSKKYAIAKKLSEKEKKKRLLKIGKLVKTLRKKRTTQERFAIELEMNKATLINYEKGGNMSISKLLEILHGLDITAEQFFKLVDEMPKGDRG